MSCRWVFWAFSSSKFCLNSGYKFVENHRGSGNWIVILYLFGKSRPPPQSNIKSGVMYIYFSFQSCMTVTGLKESKSCKKRRPNLEQILVQTAFCMSYAGGGGYHHLALVYSNKYSAGYMQYILLLIVWNKSAYLLVWFFFMEQMHLQTTQKYSEMFNFTSK